MPDTPTESPEHKDQQDQVFGKTVARKAEEAEQAASAGEAPDDEREREVEPHAGGKA